MTFCFEYAGVAVNTIKIDDGSPLYAAINSRTGILYLSYPLSNFVLMVNTRSKHVEAKMGLNFPQHLAVNSNSGKAYVDCADGIYVIDCIENRVVDVIKNSKTVESGRIAIDQRRNIIYTTCLSDDDAVTVIDGSKDSIIEKVKSGGKSPKGIAYDESYNQIFVVNSKSNSVSIIDSISNELTDTFKIKSSPWYTGPKNGPETVLVNSALQLLYVKMRVHVVPSMIAVSNITEALYVIDIESHKSIKQCTLDFLDEEGIAFNPVASMLFARRPKNTILKFDPRGKIIGTIEIEKGNIMERIAPVGKEAIAINPTTDKLYVTSSGQSLLYELVI